MITQQAQTPLGDIQNAVAAISVVFRQALKVIINTGNDVGQRIQRRPVRHLLAGNQLFADIAAASGDILGGAGQRHHRQTTAHAGEQLINGLKLTMVPLVGNKGVDGFAGLFQRVTRLLHHQLVYLCDVLRSGQALHVAIQAITLLVTLQTENALQAGFDVQHAASHIHQRGIGHGRLAADQTPDLLDLLQQHPARLPQAKHGQRIGNTLHDRLQRLQTVKL